MTRGLLGVKFQDVTLDGAGRQCREVWELRVCEGNATLSHRLGGVRLGCSHIFVCVSQCVSVSVRQNSKCGVSV